MALSQADINEINALIASYINDNKTKVSTLPEAQSLTGLWILGVSAGASVRASMALLKGLDGKNPELRNTGIELQWRVEGGTWAKLVDIADIRGFKQMLQKTSTEIQSKYENEQQWQTLLTLSELKGEKGDKGDAFEYSDFTPLQLEALKVKGDKGDTGEPGAKGDKGDKGETGDTGAKGDKGDKGDKGETGLKGDKGDTGSAGPANSLSIGTVSSGASPSASITGTAPDQILNLTLEKGEKGDKGDKGDKGETGSQGIQGEKGDTGAQGIQGDKGDKGDKGEKGDTGQGLPAGGSTGQQLVKKSATDYDYDWETPAGAGDMLKSVYDPSNKNGDAFSQDNMKDGTNNKNFTQTDRDNIAEKYVKPGTGIPKADLATAVQTSLGKADSALQSFTETDPTVPSWAKQANKPAYTATEVGAIPVSQKGANNGVAELDSGGKVPSSQLPSYVDDVLEYATLTNFPTTGETGKIYVATNTNLTYRWTGSAYVEISPSIALGETSATAYRGDRGKTAYDHSQTSHAPSNAQKNSDITKAEIEAKLTGTITTHSHTVTKANVGLENVDNVKQIPYSEKGANNGVAELDSTGKVLSSQLPSYVDDVLEYATSANFPTTGETGKIYIAINTNLTYRWTGTAYTEISPSIAIGETSATAYRGDRGKIAYDHSQSAHAPANAQKNSDITKAEIEAKLTGAVTSHTHAYVGTSGNETIAGTKTFSTIPVLPASNPTSDNQAARKKYVDDGLSAKLDSSKMQVVASLPGSPDANTYYFIPE